MSRPLWPDPLGFRAKLRRNRRFWGQKDSFKAKNRARAQFVHRTFHRCGKDGDGHVGLNLLAAPNFVAALWGKIEGKHQGSAIIASVCRGSQRREKSRRGARKASRTTRGRAGYNRGRTAATPIEPLGGLPGRKIVKRTFQPNTRHQAKTHGFRVRMRTRAGRAVIARRRRKGRARLTH